MSSVLNYEDINPSTATDLFSRVAAGLSKNIAPNGAGNSNSPHRGPDTRPSPPDQRKASAPHSPRTASAIPEPPGPEHFEEKTPCSPTSSGSLLPGFFPTTPIMQKKVSFTGSSTSPWPGRLPGPRLKDRVLKIQSGIGPQTRIRNLHF